MVGPLVVPSVLSLGTTPVPEGAYWSPLFVTSTGVIVVLSIVDPALKHRPGSCLAPDPGDTG